MSVEAAPASQEGEAPVVAPAPQESEIVALLKEQNALLRKMVAAVRPPAPDPKIAKARAVAAAVKDVEGLPYIAVDVESGAHAFGKTIAGAADALAAPPGRSLVMRSGGRPVRLQTPCIGGR